MLLVPISWALALYNVLFNVCFGRGFAKMGVRTPLVTGLVIIVYC